MKYTDGSPVVRGPFGGDQPNAVEQRLMAAAEARRQRWAREHPWRARWRRWRGRPYGMSR